MFFASLVYALKTPEARGAAFVVADLLLRP
jgi:hypothetical protein